NPCACPPAPHGGAKAHRLKAGGFNLSMENKLRIFHTYLQKLPDNPLNIIEFVCLGREREKR
ncbi:hypothetical protein, partial [Ectopseudomonas oleovorans]|uniref:hypothetical protein n=1 Tax=Ectopseudomonas oleovorans TaxID=301 RepID=UPI0019CFA3F2